MSAACADAMRIPISRVRSVTETSMMFMMPMPPTSSETDAIAASRVGGEGARRRLLDLQHVGQVLDAKKSSSCPSAR